MNEQQMSCFLVEKLNTGEIQNSLTNRTLSEVKTGEVLLEVQFSSLNYKDAMAASGNVGIVKTFPHVPGIDAVGIVMECRDARFHPGDMVIATGHELGVERWGGWSTRLVSPAEWLVPLPDQLTPAACMTLGTAGFTAAQAIQALHKHGCRPEDGEVIVSGATGGVGSLSVMLLAQLGFSVVAVTGKGDRHDWLRELGASRVVGREVLDSDPQRPLLNREFAAGIDTVGGPALATMLKMIQQRGCIACCGVVGGGELATTVYPFILRGLALYGIDSAWCPDTLRAEIWKKLATSWKLEKLNQVYVELSFSTLGSAIQEILAGKFAGRGVVRIAE